MNVTRRNCVFRKAVSVLLALAMILSSIVSDNLYSTEAAETEHEHTYENGFCTVAGCSRPYQKPEGEGTSTAPYLIDNAGKLYYFAGIVNGNSKICVDGVEQNTSAYAKLTADIVVNEGTVDGKDDTLRKWNILAYYGGTFDGNNHTISGLYMYESSSKKAGFVSNFNSGKCKNLGIVNSYFRTYSGALGSIAAQSGGTIENCYSTACLESVCATRVGGLVGYADGYRTIKNSYFAGTVQGNFDRENVFGGIDGCYSYDNTTKTGTFKGNCENCYYISGTAVNVVREGAEARTKEQFASGRVAYELNGDQSTIIYGQTLSGEAVTPEAVQPLPVLGGKQVCVETKLPCPSIKPTTGFKNGGEDKLSYEYPQHDYEDGFCRICDIYEAPEGKGTRAEPYLIDNAGKLYYFAGIVNGDSKICVNDVKKNASAHAKLTADIVVNEGTVDGKDDTLRKWNMPKSYSGTFDGNNHTISGLYMYESSKDKAGLFNIMCGTCKNVGIVNSYFRTESGAIGSIAAELENRIENCYSMACLESESGTCAGGLAGYVNSYNWGEISNSYFAGTVQGNFDRENVFGGIVGYYSYDNTTRTGTFKGSCENCYYLSGTAVNAVCKGTEAKTKEQFASGSVAYKLNGDQSKIIYGQILSGEAVTPEAVQPFPVLGGKQVCIEAKLSCPGMDTTDGRFYNGETNTLTYEYPQHDYEDGFCRFCDACEAPEGKGTYAAPYLIDNAGKLYYFAGIVNGDSKICVNGVKKNTSAYAKLTADIIVNEGTVDGKDDTLRKWNILKQYWGTFDGNNHTISGLYMYESSNNRAGFVSWLSSGTCKNLGIVNSYFRTESGTIGSIAARSSGTIENCYSTACLESESGTYAGGLAGYMDGYEMIKNSYFAGTVQGNFDRENVFGGIDGYYSYDKNTKTGTFQGSCENCYYISGTAVNAVREGAEARTKEQFASGRVAYELNGDQSKIIFGQTLSGEAVTPEAVQSLPVLGGKQVCVETKLPCPNAKPTAGFKNGGEDKLSYEYPQHDYEDGFCRFCDVYEAPEGKGTSTEPYLIDNAGKLYYFAGIVNGNSKICVDGVERNTSAYAKLTADIIVNEGTVDGKDDTLRKWNMPESYGGIFDGNNHTISGLYMYESSNNRAGLFGRISGTCKNLGIVNSYFRTESGAIGSIAAVLRDTIENCYSTACLESESGTYAGGLAGYIDDFNLGKIKNSYFAGTVQGNFDRENVFGGIVGYYSYDNTTRTGTFKGSCKNCYYISGTAVNAVREGAEARTKEQFASGRVAYELNGDQSTIIYGQTLSGEAITPEAVQPFPVLGGKRVCTETKLQCPGSELTVNSFYNGETNRLTYEYPQHDYEDGFCRLCGGCEAPEGKGTETSPYLIDNVGKLYYFAGIVNDDSKICVNGVKNNTSACAKLTADIIVNEGTVDGKDDTLRKWNILKEYGGTFDGNNHTISGLYMCESSSSNAGFVRVLSGTCKNLGIVNSYFRTESGTIGSIAAYLYGTVENCYSTACLESESGTHAGGLAGTCQSNATLKNSYFAGTVQGSFDRENVFGGIVGYYSYDNTTRTGTFKGNCENCYYITGTAVNAVCKGAEARTKEQFASGQVAYRLNGDQRKIIYGQTLSGEAVTPEAVQEFPVLGGQRVCVETKLSCPGINVTDGRFYNGEADKLAYEYPQHVYENGFCRLCDAYEVPQGEGTKTSPYLIDNAGKLYYFAGIVNGDSKICVDGVVENASACAKLTADIIVNKGIVDGKDDTLRKWDTVDNYTGTFDGANHTISGLYVYQIGDGLAGLFCYLSGRCQNVGIVNSYYHTDSGTLGSITGVLNGTIENCYSTACLESESGTRAGGLAGTCQSNATLKNSYFAGTIQGSFDRENVFGGITGCSTYDSDAKTGTFQGSCTNCYYISGSAVNVVREGASARTKEQFTSGQVAYELNGDQSEILYGQTLSGEAVTPEAVQQFPVLGGKQVCVKMQKDCPDSTAEAYITAYINGTKNVLEYAYGVYANGFCIWCGKYETPKGDGTKENPYKISNAGELYYFAGIVNGDEKVCVNGVEKNPSACAQLTADIVVNEGIVDGKKDTLRIWTVMNTFLGTFDGNNHTISGLCVCKTDGSNAGLFNDLSGTCKNVGIVNSYIFTDSGKLGSIAANMSGTIENCYSTACLESESGTHAGGLVGSVAGLEAKISNSYFAGTVQGSFDRENVFGGISGYTMYDTDEKTGAFSGSCENCYYISGTAVNVARNSTYARTKEQFASGQVAYELNGDQGTIIYGQTLSGEAVTPGAVLSVPVLGGKQVYQYKILPCPGVMDTDVSVVLGYGYTNNGEERYKYIYKDHKYDSDDDEKDDTYYCVYCQNMKEHEHMYENGICGLCCSYQVPAGDGSKEHPYEISNAGQLFYFAKVVEGSLTVVREVTGNATACAVLTAVREVTGNAAACAILTADINLTDVSCAADSAVTAVSGGVVQWKAIGLDRNVVYAGTFNGQGHTIYGLSSTGEAAGAFFAGTGTNAVVKNVSLKHCDIRSYLAGGISIINEGTIENCMVDGEIQYGAATVDSMNEEERMLYLQKLSELYTDLIDNDALSVSKMSGGVCIVNQGTVDSCFVSGAAANLDKAGYICAENEEGTVTNCYYYADSQNIRETEQVVGKGIGHEDVKGKAESVSMSDIRSGKVTWMLDTNNTYEGNKNIWKQDVKTSSPTFVSEGAVTIYYLSTTKLDGTTQEYYVPAGSDISMYLQNTEGTMWMFSSNAGTAVSGTVFIDTVMRRPVIIIKEALMPTGSITLGEKNWTKFEESEGYTVRLLKGSVLNVTADSQDTRIAYYIHKAGSAAESTLTLEELMKKSFTAYDDAEKPVLKEKGYTVIYVRFTGDNGLVNYISTEGLMLSDPYLLTVMAPEEITGVANGTMKDAAALGLPETVAITTEDESVTSASVTWNLDKLVSGSYDSNVTTKQTFTVSGTVVLPEGIDANDIPLIIQVTVTVDAKKTGTPDEPTPGDPTGSPVDPGTPDDPTGSPIEPGTPTGSPVEPGDPTGSPVEPGTPTGSPIEPGEPTGSPIEPGTPTGSPIEPGTPTGSPIEPGEPTGSPVDPSTGEAVIPGDVNGDGEIKLNDAQLALRAALLLDELSERAQLAADVNGDGKMKLDDAQQILRRALLLIDDFKKVN